MNNLYNHRQAIALSVLFCFVFFLHAVAAPPAAERSDKIAAADGADHPAAVEKEGGEVRKKSSIWKWVLLGAGALAVGTVAYLLLHKKPSYTLTVTLGDGVSGTPAAGSQTYKKGTTVSYSYTLAGSGYRDLAVAIDGKPAAASGSLKMDADHQISATSAKVISVAVNSTPAGALIYDNGARSGKQTNTLFEYAAGGAHSYLLRLCGYQDFSQSVEAVPGQPQTLNALLKPGIGEEFDVELASCWRAFDAKEWNVSGGLLRASSISMAVNSLAYDVPFGQKNYTVVTRAMVTQGAYSWHNTLSGIMLANDSNPIQTSGYSILIYPDGWYRLFAQVNTNLREGGSGWLVNYRERFMPEIVGINGWNTLKVVRSNYRYTVYVNDVFCDEFFDAQIDPRYTVLLFGSIYDAAAHFDYVRQEIGTAAPAVDSSLTRAEARPSGRQMQLLRGGK